MSNIKLESGDGHSKERKQNKQNYWAMQVLRFHSCHWDENWVAQGKDCWVQNLEGRASKGEWWHP